MPEDPGQGIKPDPLMAAAGMVAPDGTILAGCGLHCSNFLSLLYNKGL